MNLRDQTSAQKLRRPIAGLFRWTTTGAVDLCRQRGIHPNTVSLASLVAGAGTATALIVAGQAKLGLHFAPAAFPLAILLAVIFGGLRLWLNRLDGMVAQATDQTTALGEVFNELPDRVSDLLIFMALAISGLCQPSLALGAAIASLLIAYTGTLARAVGAGRQLGGVMSKPWRMVAVGAGLLVPLMLQAFWGPMTSWVNIRLIQGLARVVTAVPALQSAAAWVSAGVSGLNFLDLMLFVLFAGSLQTLWVRLRGIHRSLRHAAERRSWATFSTPRAAA